MEASKAPESGDRWQAESPEDAVALMDAELFSNAALPGAEPGATCPPKYPCPLPRDDEDTEVVMALLWMAFATGAANGNGVVEGPDITFRALEAGRERMRGYVYDQVVIHGTGGGWVAPLEARWRDLGFRAIERANKDSKTEIDFGHFDTAWGLKPPIPDTPARPLPNPVDHATEVIGSQLWFHLQLGALFGADLPYDSPEGIVRRGRLLSRYWVRSNVISRKIVVGADIDYGPWPNEAKSCAFKAGRRANRDAVRSGSPTVTPDHLESAWCSVHDGVMRLFQRCGVNLRPWSAACG